MRVEIQDYHGNYYDNTAAPGTWYANITYGLLSPWPFPAIPPAPQPPSFTSYCRVIMSATYNGTTKYGASSWTYPDVNGFIYPDLITIPFF